jgi:starvation-inducible DNA-binding protein
MGEDGTNDLLVSQLISIGELQAWLVAEHLVDTPLLRT